MSEVVESKRQLLPNLRLALCAIALIATAAPAAAQQPTSAQRDALRASCRNDFIAHCSGVQPGGKAAFLCLQKSMSSLSGACQQAVNAVAASAAPAAAPAAQPAAAPPPAAPDAAKPAEASTTPTPPPAAAPAAKPAAKPPAQAAVAPAAAPPAAPPPPMMGRPLPLRTEIMLIRTTCGPDFRALCGDVAPGGGRVIACLRANGASLSPRCQGALAALQ